METNFDLVKKSHSQFHPYRSHNSIWREHITSNMKEKTCLKHYYSNNLKTEIQLSRKFPFQLFDFWT